MSVLWGIQAIVQRVVIIEMSHDTMSGDHFTKLFDFQRMALLCEMILKVWSTFRRAQPVHSNKKCPKTKEWAKSGPKQTNASKKSPKTNECAKNGPKQTNEPTKVAKIWKWVLAKSIFVRRLRREQPSVLNLKVKRVIDEAEETSGQSYKASAGINYDSIVVITSKLLIFMTLDS